MPLNTLLLGKSTEVIRTDVDARWTMAYAASLGDFNRRYLDTSAGTAVGHPVFPVCLEWPAILASRRLPGAEALTEAERMRGVHAAHDLHIYRLLEAGESVATKATIVSVKAATPGALLVTRIDTTDRSDKLICRSFHSTILRDVRIVNSFDCTAGEPTIPTVPRAAHEARDQARFTLVVPEGLAHIYSECARIWNPIHTDRAFALAAGLTDIILHGTATLALSVSRLVNEFMAGDPTPIRRISCRFSGMVPVPSVLTLKVHSHLRQTIRFSLVTNHGSVALRDGYLSYRVRG